jgi:hypothetical protein
MCLPMSVFLWKLVSVSCSTSPDTQITQRSTKQKNFIKIYYCTLKFLNEINPHIDVSSFHFLSVHDQPSMPQPDMTSQLQGLYWISDHIVWNQTL